MLAFELSFVTVVDEGECEMYELYFLTIVNSPDYSPELVYTYLSDSSPFTLSSNLLFFVIGKGNTSRSSGIAEELEEQIKAGAIG